MTDLAITRRYSRVSHSVIKPRTLTLLGLSIFAVARAATAEQFQMQVVSATHAEANASGASGGGASQDHPLAASADAQGNEQSFPLMPPARRSAARSRANFRLDSQSPTSATFVLSANAYANGGHSVQFGGSGQDTNGSAAATSSATLAIQFDKDAVPIRYLVSVASQLTSSGAALTYSLRGPQGATLLTEATPSREAIVAALPASLLTLNVALRATASNGGGCCSETRDGNATIIVNVVRAPILYSQAQQGSRSLATDGSQYRIIGGKITDGYPYVGSIFSNRLLHCTGTLVAPRTVVTAAHCLYKYDFHQLTFRIGTYSWDSDALEFAVEGVALPSSDGFLYDDRNRDDDIGLLYLKTAPSSAPFTRLYTGDPSIESLLSAKKVFTFIGFGYDFVEGEKADPGYRRQVDLPISSVQAKGFRYQLPGANTCDGDSGGPAFFTQNGKRYLGGVTSRGDAGCTQYGIDTRVDVFAKWLTDRLR